MCQIKQNQKSKLKNYLFFIIIFSLTIPLISIQYFSAFKLLSDDNLVVISEEGIIKYNIETNEEKIIYSSNFLSSASEQEFVSFAQFPLDKGGYVFCRIQSYIFIFSQNLNITYGYFEIEEISNLYCVMTPYTTKENGNLTMIFSIISDGEIKLLMYKINLNETDNLGSLLNQVSHSVINSEGTSMKTQDKGNTCELMPSSNYSYLLLTCFAIDIHTRYFVGATFDPENSLSFLYFSENLKPTNGSTCFKSILTYDKKKALIAIVDFNKVLHYVVYDSENKIFSNLIKLIDDCSLFTYNLDIKYIEEEEEYIIYSVDDSNKIKFIKFDKQLNIKGIDEDGDKCYSSFTISTSPCYTVFSYKLLYVGKYYLLRTCEYNGNKFFNVINATETCNMKIDNGNENDLFSSVPSTSSNILESTITMYETTTPTSLTSIPEKDNISTLLFSSIIISTSISTTTISTDINSMKSELLTSTPKTTINMLKSELLSSIISINTFSSLLSSDSSSKSKTNFISQFYEEGDIIKAKIYKNKEELENNLDELMEIIDIGKKYEIGGNDYNITITPINDLNSFKSTFVDFSKCEEILRNEYNLPKDEILTTLQIEIDRVDERALTNKVEYAIYDEQKNMLNLSYCKNVEIKITYDITDQSLLNKTMISYYSEIGIDVFNINDTFFNDLCYSFSISDSDIILEDRVSDLYQNYSLCDDGCKYEQINIVNMSVTCSCSVKSEINTEISTPVFSEIVLDTFKDSNFGVLRCYNLVFSIDNKSHNMGFLIFLFLVIAHIICFALYFIKGINSIVAFTFKEMERNNYITRIYNPKKKNINNSKIDQISANSDYNSQFLMNNLLLEKKNKKNSKKVNKEKSDKIKKFRNSLKTCSKKNKKNQPIFIFNYKYDNNYYKINNKSSSQTNSNHINKKKEKKIFNTKHKMQRNKNKTILNEEKGFPGYYNLIQINADNSPKKQPPESKYILNNYYYETAKKYESRDFWRIYYICLLSKENILNTFFFKSPLEKQSIKLSIFIFTYSCDIALNALFFVNEKISDRYHYEGDSLYYFIFVNNMTISIFSTLSSYLLVKGLYLLTNSKYSIEQLFRDEEKKMRKNKQYKVDLKTKKNIYRKLLEIYKVLKIKLLCYIIVELLIMLFFFYFITAFCEVYKSSQTTLLYDSFISIILSILYELFISFVISLLYITSLKLELKFLYKFVLFSYKLG